MFGDKWRAKFTVSGFAAFCFSWGLLPVPYTLFFGAARVEKNLGGAYTEYAYNASGEPIGENNRTTQTQWRVASDECQALPDESRH